MTPKTTKTLQEHEKLLLELNIPSNELKRKYIVGKAYRTRPHSCNSGGGKGRAGRRVKGWRKHGKGPQNVSFGHRAKV